MIKERKNLLKKYGNGKINMDISLSINLKNLDVHVIGLEMILQWMKIYHNQWLKFSWNYIKKN